MDSPRVEKKDIAPSLKRPIDETVSTLVTYALIVNTLSSFGIKIEDPRDYVKFFPSTLVIVQLRAAICRFVSLRGVKRRSNLSFQRQRLLRYARNDNLSPLVTEQIRTLSLIPRETIFFESIPKEPHLCLLIAAA